MRIRKAVKVAAWGLMIGLPLMGVASIWSDVSRWPLLGMPPSIWDFAQELLSLAPQLLIPVFVGVGLGGACLLIADIHERHLEGER